MRCVGGGETEFKFGEKRFKKKEKILFINIKTPERLQMNEIKRHSTHTHTSGDN